MDTLSAHKKNSDISMSLFLCVSSFYYVLVCDLLDAQNESITFSLHSVQRQLFHQCDKTQNTFSSDSQESNVVAIAIGNSVSFVKRTVIERLKVSF